MKLILTLEDYVEMAEWKERRYRRMLRREFKEARKRAKALAMRWDKRKGGK